MTISRTKGWARAPLNSAIRSDLQHNLFLKMMENNLHLAPIKKDISHVLDVGTGTGLWAIEFGEYSLSPARPLQQWLTVSPSGRVSFYAGDWNGEYSGREKPHPIVRPTFIPPNLTFMIDDAEKDWTFPHKFDYIHGRALLGSFENWPRFFEQSLQHLQPGGWLEMQDVAYPPASDDGTLAPAAPLARWADLMIDASNKIGRPLSAPKDYRSWMERAGFTDVQELRYKWPQNTWPRDRKYKDLGLWTQANIEEGLQGFTVALFTRVHGWSNREVDVFLDGVRKDIRNKDIHSYWPSYVVYGRKPEAA
ncbi:hypothetical protein FGG08_000492 [Glutinoglossum americanum]|uniref:S-adenosyl-L-methionine-dependent methyltransferase n=1 Tax=Glutinoglossum americanum TaxID=1670608 RepID=A0A9P8I3V8_9PEZI|nr:hypothetical protein FGG08_000492 [Glutinoglossum americanum]